MYQKSKEERVCVLSCEKYSFNNICVDECENNYYKNGNQCVEKCPIYSEGSLCVSQCSEGKLLNNKTKQCVDVCQEGAYNYNGVCYEGCENVYGLKLFIKDQICVQFCDKYHYGDKCVNDCAENNLLIKSPYSNECVDKCEEKEVIYESTCYSKCSLVDVEEPLYEYNKQCYKNCEDAENENKKSLKIDRIRKKCYDTCPYFEFDGKYCFYTCDEIGIDTIQVDKYSMKCYIPDKNCDKFTDYHEQKCVDACRTNQASYNNVCYNSCFEVIDLGVVSRNTPLFLTKDFKCSKENTCDNFYYEKEQKCNGNCGDAISTTISICVDSCDSIDSNEKYYEEDKKCVKKCSSEYGLVNQDGKDICIYCKEEGDNIGNDGKCNKDSCPLGQEKGENGECIFPAKTTNDCLSCSTEGLDHCNEETGDCICKIGYYGTTCSLTETDANSAYSNTVDNMFNSETNTIDLNSNNTINNIIGLSRMTAQKKTSFADLNEGDPERYEAIETKTSKFLL